MTAQAHQIDLSASYPGFQLRARASWSASRAALFGPSGSGKSSILEAMLGLRDEVRGTVRLGGRDRHGLSIRDRGLAWVPQDAALLPHRSVRQNLLFAAASGERIDEVAGALQIHHLLERRTTSLSGGERQRVALGRALLSGRDFLLLDEPLASLDRPLRKRVAEYLLEQSKRHSLSWLLVSHDPEEVARLADETLLLRDGAVEAVLPTREALERAYASALDPDH